MNRRKFLSFLIVIMIGIAAGLVYYHYFYYDEPEAAITEAMDALVNQDEEKAEQYLDYQAVYGVYEDYALYCAVMRDFSCELESLTQDKGTAVAVLKVQNRDIEKIYGEFVVEAYQLVISDAYLPEEDRMDETELKHTIDAMLLEALTEKETDIRSAEIEVEMTRTGRSWYMTLDEDDRDAIYGGFLSAQKDAGNVLGDRSTEALSKLEEAYQQNIDDASHVLRNAAHYMVDDVWNDVVCHIVSCVNAGTDADGGEYDLEAGLEELSEVLEAKEEYDSYIASLDDVNYAEIKESWEKLSSSCDALVSEIEEEQPEPLDYDYLPDTTEFESAMEEFVTLVYPEAQ